MRTANDVMVFFMETAEGMTGPQFAEWLNGCDMTPEQRVAAMAGFCVGADVNPTEAMKILKGPIFDEQLEAANWVKSVKGRVRDFRDGNIAVPDFDDEPRL